MSPIRFWFAILAILGFVIVAPAWLYFAGPAANGLPRETQYLVGLIMPLALMFTLASWLQPR